MEPAATPTQPPSRARTHRSSQRTAWWWRAWVLLPWVVGLGAVSSIVIAWGVGVSVVPDRLIASGLSVLPPEPPDDPSVNVNPSAFGVPLTVYRSDSLAITRFDAAGDADDLRSDGTFASAPGISPWKESLLAKRSRGLGSTACALYAQGIPFRCFQGADFPDAWPEPITIGLIKFGVFNERVICFQPRWVALALDTLFWGAIWMGLILIPLATRRARRRKKGLCPECAYDLRGELTQGCPECGWNREPVAVSFPT